MGGRRRPAPRAPLDTGFRRYDARGGVREGREVGTSPRRAPALGSRESGNDDGGCGGMRWREGFGSGWWPVARSRGRAVREPPLRPGWGARGRGCARGLLVVEGPLRVPSGQASTGSGRTDLGGAPTTGSGGCDGGCGGMSWREGFGSGWGPALAGGRFANRPYDRGGAHEGGGVRGGCWWWRGPSSALRTGFDRLRANGFGRGAYNGEWGMRWGVWWDELARGVGVRVGARSRGRAVREPPLRPGWGARGRGCARGLLVVEGPFDRLRANGFGKRSCRGEWGMRWGAFAR